MKCILLHLCLPCADKTGSHQSFR